MTSILALIGLIFIAVITLGFSAFSFAQIFSGVKDKDYAYALLQLSLWLIVIAQVCNIVPEIYPYI